MRKACKKVKGFHPSERNSPLAQNPPEKNTCKPCPGEFPSPTPLCLLGPREETRRACQLGLLIKEVTHQEVLTLVLSERPVPNVRLPGQVTHWKCLSHATRTDVKCVTRESPERWPLGPGSSPDPRLWGQVLCTPRWDCSGPV